LAASFAHQFLELRPGQPEDDPEVVEVPEEDKVSAGRLQQCAQCGGRCSMGRGLEHGSEHAQEG
jgi:hypothetical protein